MKKYILHIARNYSFEILRPIQAEILKRGGECVWFAGSDSVDLTGFYEDEQYVTTPQEVNDYESCAVLSPGNNAPGFLNGIKVQVFHGLEWKKKGHFRIRDFFDRYCTQGPVTTDKFIELANLHRIFLVRETGWSKLDPLFTTAPFQLNTKKPVVLYAPTFSTKLTSAQACFDEIKKISNTGEFFWLIKFHPLMDPKILVKYKSIESESLMVVGDHSILPLLVKADVMVSDTSSVIGEFMLLNKPVVAFKNSVPEDSMINISSPDELTAGIKTALSDSAAIKEKILTSNKNLHPYTDGHSSARILDAVDEMLAGAKAEKT